MRPRFCSRCLPVVAALVLLGLEPAYAQEFRLTILHTNDIHGHVLPFAYVEAGRGAAERASVGGAARRATLIRRLRLAARNPVVLIDAGDVFTRGALTNAYEGVADVEGMNATGYDLAAIGNNEFKARDGVDRNDAAGAQHALLQVVKRSRFPWLCANVHAAGGSLLEGVQPYVVRQFRGVRVGFLGLTAPRSGEYPQTRGWAFENPAAAAKEWIPRARKDCDVLIAVTHIGTPLDMLLAAQSRGIDAIVGGDSHTFLYKPAVVPDLDRRPVPIVQAGEFGANIGRLDLTFRKARGRWQLTAFQGRLIPVGPDLPEDAGVAAALAPYLAPFRQVVGSVRRIGSRPAERMRVTTQVLVDALRSAASADVALNPAGAGMFDPFPGKRVTRYDVYAAMPFHNNVVAAALSGSELRALLRARPETVASPAHIRLEDARQYHAAFVDFVAASEYGLSSDRLKDTGQDIRTAVVRWLTASGTGSGPGPGRAAPRPGRARGHATTLPGLPTGTKRAGIGRRVPIKVTVLLAAPGARPVRAASASL